MTNIQLDGPQTKARPFLVPGLVLAAGLFLATWGAFALLAKPLPPAVSAPVRLERRVTVTVKGSDLDRDGTKLICQEVGR